MLKETRNLVVFFTATFIWTWACYAPIAISGSSPYSMPWMGLLILGGAGPSIVGIGMVLTTYNKEQRKDYWRRCFSLKRIDLLWWAVILLIFPVLFAIGAGLDVLTGGSLPGLEQFYDLMRNPLSWPLAALISFMSGPWSEEFGWRGYVLEPLLKRFSTLRGSILLGFVWGVWHLPLFFMPATWHGKMGFQLAGLWTFILLSVGLSLTMTWVYKNTNRSILAGMLLHFTSNFTAQLAAPGSDNLEILRAVLVFLVGFLGCWIYERQHNQPAAVSLSINSPASPGE
jgi:membrane protease YdiL (CAAX protease family)